MKDLIYNQRDIPRDQWRYGFRTSAATGCGWIATYNALGLLGCRAKPEDLILWFERCLPLIHGNFGTILPAPALFFKQQGFPVKLSALPARYDALARESDAAILFYRWRKGLKLGTHFVALEYKDGRFVGYNTYKNSTGPDDYGESLEAFLKRKGYFGTVLMGIRRR